MLTTYDFSRFNLLPCPMLWQNINDVLLSHFGVEVVFPLATELPNGATKSPKQQQRSKGLSRRSTRRSSMGMPYRLRPSQSDSTEGCKAVVVSTSVALCGSSTPLRRRESLLLQDINHKPCQPVVGLQVIVQWLAAVVRMMTSPFYKAWQSFRQTMLSVGILMLTFVVIRWTRANQVRK